MNFRLVFAKAFLTTGFYVIASQILGFVGLWSLLKFLTAKEVGTFASIAAFSNFLLIFSLNGISQVVHRERYDRAKLCELSLISVLVGGVSSVLLCLFAWPIDLYYRTEGKLILPTVVLSLVFVIQSFWSVPRAEMQRLDLYGQVGRVIFLGQAVNSGSQILLAWAGYSYWSMIFCQMLSNLYISIHCLWKTGIYPRYYGFASLSAHLRYVRGFLFNLSGITLIQYGMRNIDNMLIGRYFGQSVLGVYDIAYKFLFFPLMAIAGVAAQVIYPMFGKIKDDKTKLEEEYFYLLGVLNMLGWIASLGISVVAVQAISLLKSEWQEVAAYLPYFGIMLYFQTMISPIGAFYILLKKEKSLLWITIVNGVTILLGFVVAVFLGPLYFARMPLLQNIFVGIPYVLIWAVYRDFGFDFKRLLWYWTPKMVAGLCLFCMLEWGSLDWFYGVCLGYSLVILAEERRKLRRMLIVGCARLGLKV